MRMPLQNRKRTLRVARMKTTPARNKDSKSGKDYLSETISFVIKGKLTPITPTYPKSTMAKTKTKKCIPTKTAKKPSAQKTKKSTPDTNTTESSKKPVNTSNKTDLKKKTRPEKKSKRNIRGKSPDKVKQKIKENVEQNQKIADDIKTKQTIEKLLKEANKALKPIKSCKKNKRIVAKKEKKPIKQEIKKCKSELDEIKPELEIKNEPDDAKKRQKKIASKPNLVLMKKRVITAAKNKAKRKENQRKMKLFSFWNGPKRHRVASLNALAKVHCLYENETRSNLLDPVEKKESESDEKKTDEDEIIPCTRTLRSVPGLRAVGKHWDMHDTTSSSEDNSGYESTGEIEVKPKAKIKKESVKKSECKNQKRRRNRPELVMDLKDMVVRKRMASLNASAILAASYSVEKRAAKSPNKSDSEIDSSDYFVTDAEDEQDTKFFEAKVKKEEDSKLIEVRATPNKKVAVILNQDTDVTITGMYVNSTTRSTHHEGYCSIAGMQYRISATSHTQTAATAVATETLLQSSSSSTQENSNSESLTSCKSYTPLDALSNMQPPPGPGIQHPHQQMGPPQHVLPLPQHQLSPSRRPGCPSAFSAPHGAPPYPPGHPHSGDPGYVHGKCGPFRQFN